MRQFLYGLIALLSIVAWTLAGYAIAGIEGMVFAQIAPATLSDSGIVKQWRSLSREAFWLSVWKAGFTDPAYTGTEKSRRGINNREDIMGPPFVEYYDLQNMAGDRLTDTIHIPPFEGDDEVLFGTGADAGYVRVKGQNRVGFEIQGSRKNIDFALQSYFMSAKEEDINMSEQELGGELLPLLVEHLSDLHGRYIDASRIMSYHLGYSPHVYARIGQAGGASNGSAVTGSTDLGVPAPYEHPNTFAWTNSGTLSSPVYSLVNANSIATAAATSATADNWTGKVHEAVGQVNSNALPNRKMLDEIIRQIKLLRLVPIRYLSDNGGAQGKYLMLVSPAMMNLLINDADIQARFDSAYDGAMRNHPLINENDKMYRTLIIREVEKFEQDLYTYKYNLSADTYDYGTTADGGLDARPTLSTGVDCTPVSYAITGSGRDQRVSLTMGTRRFRNSNDGNITAPDATAAGEDTAIGEDGGDKIDRVVVLGASALGCVPGPIFPMERRQEDEYGNILGIGQEKLSADRRIDFPTSRSHNSGYDNQGSMTIAVYNGK